MDTVMHAKTPWQQDEAVVAARAREQAAQEQEANLDAEYQAAWREAVADFTEGNTTAMPDASDPCWQVRRKAARAGREVKEARRARERAEQLAQESCASTGYRIGRDMMQEGIATHFQPLKQWLADYEAMKEQVLQDTGVRLPNLGHLYLSAHGVQDFLDTIFLQNRFGDSCLEQSRHE
jgi:hypothetical protein